MMKEFTIQQPANAGSQGMPTWRLEASPDGGRLLLVGGAWLTSRRLPPAREILAGLEGGAGPVRVDGEGLTAWDTSLLIVLARVGAWCRGRQIDFILQGLPAEIQKLLALAAGFPEDSGRPVPGPRPSWLSQLGEGLLARWAWLGRALGFTGELVISLGRMVRGRARFRGVDLAHFLQDCGAGALPIVSLISLLVGLILAFIGAVQLQLFGAQLYVADLVGIGMARDMGAMMTGIIMAGRTGAAYAAQLGTMQVNEEVDALRTLGISPVEYLVLPRTLALVLMMPLLCCYADLMGILGGGLACTALFQIAPIEYLQRTREAVPLHHFTGGLVKSVVYGVIVALAGCHRGLACGRSAAAVGKATTDAVVTAIIWIVVWCAILTIVFNEIGL